MASNRSNLTTTHGSNIRLLLQAIVRSTQWTYSIFWRFSPSKGLLVWSDGFYNGGIERSFQLRKLFHSLKSEEEINQPSSKQCAALSPEDLTDTDWFYLVSMSFDFAPANCLPGRALANRCPVWLCRANEVEGRVFSRALLAKTASIQTVVCIPLSDGVLELGVTKLVPEDPGLIEHVKGFFLDDAQHVITSEISSDFSTGEDFIQPTDSIESNMSEDITTGSPRGQKGRNGGCYEHCKGSVFSEWIETGDTVIRKEPASTSSQSKLKNTFTEGEEDSELTDVNRYHVLAERRRRNKINHKFKILRSIIPFVTKTDKESVLEEAIEYLKHLQHRVLELKSHAKQTEVDHNDFQEHNPINRAIIDKQDEELSDEKHFNRVKKLRDSDDQIKSPRTAEKKVRVVEASATSPTKTSEACIAKIEVSINDDKALLELKCCWKKGLLLQIMQTLNSLHLEIYDLQSSRVQHNYFVATIKAMVIQQVGKTRNGERETIARVKEAIQCIVP